MPRLREVDKRQQQGAVVVGSVYVARGVRPLSWENSSASSSRSGQEAAAGSGRWWLCVCSPRRARVVLGEQQRLIFTKWTRGSSSEREVGSSRSRVVLLRFLLGRWIIRFRHLFFVVGFTLISVFSCVWYAFGQRRDNWPLVKLVAISLRYRSSRGALRTQRPGASSREAAHPKGAQQQCRLVLCWLKKYCANPKRLQALEDGRWVQRNLELAWGERAHPVESTRE